MADLSVTDVQRVLRNFASMGHDVVDLAHKHQTNLWGKPHGLVLHNTLQIGAANVPSHVTLQTALQQSESPLISHIKSHYLSSPTSTTKQSSITLLSPSFYSRRNMATNLYSPDYKDSTYTITGSDSGINPPHGGITRDGPSGFKDWELHPHDILANHRDIVLEHPGFVKESTRMGIERRGITPEEYKKWNARKAALSLLGHDYHEFEPFSKKIDVFHYRKGKLSVHRYDPETEQLETSYDGPDEWKR